MLFNRMYRLKRCLILIPVLVFALLGAESARAAEASTKALCHPGPWTGASFLFGNGPRDTFASLRLTPDQEWQKESWYKKLRTSANEGYRVFSTVYGYEAPSDLRILIQDRSMLTIDSAKYVRALESEKANLMALYRLSNREYNQLAAISFGILGRESEFGTNFMYYVKERLQTAVTLKKAYDNWTLDPEKNSRGLTQIKTIPPKIAEFYCIKATKDLRNPKIAAVATMGFLAESLEYMRYRARVKKLSYVNESNVFDYMLYIYFGSLSQLVNPIHDAKGCQINKVATPDHNLYILRVKELVKGLVMLEAPRAPRSEGQNNACRLRAS